MSHYDPDKREKKQAEGKSKKDQRLDDYRQVMAIPAGMRAIKEIMRYLGLLSFSSGRDAKDLWEERGRRIAAIAIAKEIGEADPSGWTAILQELLNNK